MSSPALPKIKLNKKQLMSSSGLNSQTDIKIDVAKQPKMYLKTAEKYLTREHGTDIRYLQEN